MTEVYDVNYWSNRQFEPKYWMMTFEWQKHFDLTDKTTVLDYGCGKGFHTHCLRYYGIPAEGYDISKFAAENAYGEAKGFVTNECPKKQYDLVLNLDVLEHVEEMQADIMLDELYQLTAHGGHCLFSICFKGDPNFPLDPTHVLERTKGWWMHKISKHGFQVQEAPNSFPYHNQFLIGAKQ